MPNIRDDVWEAGKETYSERQIESILEHCEIEIVSETHTHFMTYCPFHGNTDSPAFVVDKFKGLWICFNPSCGLSGKIDDLIEKTTDRSPFQAQMLIIKCKRDDTVPFADRLKQKLEAPTEIPEFSQSKLDELYENFKGSPAQTYMYGRGFEDETLDYFRIGYSPESRYPSYRPDMVTVPMHDIKGRPIGLIGRSIADKRFKNSRGLPKRLTAWNIHRAKREGEAVVIVEASFDAMRVHQAGYPNVIALLGGHVTDNHLDQINKHFSRVIIMTDYENDESLVVNGNCRKCYPKNCRGHRPGRDLGRSIAKSLPNKQILWATYDDKCVYPHNAKDVGDMTDDEIRQCLKNSISNFEYNNWNIEGQGLLW